MGSASTALLSNHTQILKKYSNRCSTGALLENLTHLATGLLLCAPPSPVPYPLPPLPRPPTSPLPPQLTLTPPPFPLTPHPSTSPQIVDERMLVSVNDLLASGEIPDLFAAEDRDEIVNAMRGETKSLGLIDTTENCWATFINKVPGGGRGRLHVCMADVSMGDQEPT